MLTFNYYHAILSGISNSYVWQTLQPMSYLSLHVEKGIKVIACLVPLLVYSQTTRITRHKKRNMAFRNSLYQSHTVKKLTSYDVIVFLFRIFNLLSCG